MDLQDYKMMMANRYESLSDDEKESISSVLGTAAGNSLAKIFGPEMNDVISVEPLKRPAVKKRGLGTR
jgi:hypothetical protein